MSKRRRHTSPQTAHAETEVWPAYVDVLAAAFVFVLLAFAALLTRDVEEAESRAKSEEEDKKGQADFNRALEGWKRAGAKAVIEAAKQMANEITPVGLAGQCSLASADELRMNPTLVAAFSEQLLELDKALRHPVTVICKFRPENLDFPQNEAQPKPEKQDEVVRKLNEIADRIAEKHCSEASQADAWCTAGLELVGHTDCVPVSGKDETNWELGARRAAWVLRQMVDGSPVLTSLSQEQFRVAAGGRASREPFQATDEICKAAEPRRALDSLPVAARTAAEGKLAENRRVELLVYLRTRQLQPRPTPPKAIRP